ncbi:MAG: YHS domain-containing (seleno)protein [Myxococcota bacterium]
MNRILSLFSLASLAMAASGPAAAGGDPSITHSAPAVQGYDVVSYHQGEKPQRGNGNHVAEFEGVPYLFVDEANRKAFERDPARYAPAYGGFCAYGVSVGKKFIGDPDVWKIVDGRLYLNLDTRVQESWAKDIPGHIRRADARWKQIAATPPGEL